MSLYTLWPSNMGSHMPSSANASPTGPYKARLTSSDRAAYDAFGEVALLMNNAAVGRGGGPWDSYENWRRLLDVNLWGVIHGVHVFAPDTYRNPVVWLIHRVWLLVSPVKRASAVNVWVLVTPEVPTWMPVETPANALSVHCT